MFCLTQSAVLGVQSLSFFFSIFNLHVPCPNFDVTTVIFPSYTHVRRDMLDPVGLLSTELSPSAFMETNAALIRVQQQAKVKETKKQGAYIKLDKKTKIRIGKYSSKNGISAAARYFLILLGELDRKRTCICP